MAEKQKKPGQFFRANIPITVGLAGILAVLVLGISVAYWYFPTNREPILFFAIAVTAAATLSGTFYLGAALRMNVVQQSQLAAFALMARWNSPELFHSRADCHRVLDAFRARGVEGVTEALRAEQVAMNIRHVLNFLEEISIAVKVGHVDEELLASAFAGLVIRAYNALGAWIGEHRRISGRQKVWAELEWLYERWHDR